ncbi:hypothetical protein CAEBREN_02690 [Caenorhabditis brenneri]|uniref:Decapping nuclease n=1 Tax=Caenorhabditis brenneri TaxID=135651 RepID=G0NTP8_CAEBE|nr:hypothetical protein CAEBREN_02690 [Caenorhabditis brenneri]
METSLKITVDTIGHYTRNNDMELINADPPRLNMKPFQRKVLPQYSLTQYEYKDTGNVEEAMKSLLNFIRAKRFPVKNKFVTTRQLLALVACGNLKKAIIVFRMYGIFLLPGGVQKSTDDNIKDHTNDRNQTEAEAALDFRRAGNFHHFMTRTTEEQPIKEDRNAFKAVMLASIEEKEENAYTAKVKHSLLYAAEIDAIGENDYEHYELKLVRGGLGNKWFWNNNSEAAYWQAYFGNVNKIICGERAETVEGKKDSVLTSLQILNRERIPADFEKKKEEYEREQKLTDEEKPEPFSGPSWNVEMGKRNLHEFFNFIKDKCKDPSVCYVATIKGSDIDGSVEWDISPAHCNPDDNKQANEFLKVLIEQLPMEEPMKEADALKANEKESMKKVDTVGTVKKELTKEPKGIKTDEIETTKKLEAKNTESMTETKVVKASTQLTKKKDKQQKNTENASPFIGKNKYSILLEE